MRILTILALFGLLKMALGVEAPEGKEVLLVDDLKQPFLISHELQVNIFLGSGGEGMVRMLRAVPGIHGIINPGPLARAGKPMIKTCGNRSSISLVLLPRPLRECTS